MPDYFVSFIYSFLIDVLNIHLNFNFSFAALFLCYYGFLSLIFLSSWSYIYVKLLVLLWQQPVSFINFLFYSLTLGGIDTNFFAPEEGIRILLK